MVFFYTECEEEANKKFISHINGPAPHILNPSVSDLYVALPYPNLTENYGTVRDKL